MLSGSGCHHSRCSTCQASSSQVSHVRRSSRPRRPGANRAYAQAVTIATALGTAERGTPVHAEWPVPFTPGEATDDYREEAAWLATVATAYSTSTTVAEILKETSSHAADPVH
ncbi:DUF6545 domain-containing protein [Amycolatopsis sp. cmx-11-32]|uniref:DUF6545 domain-containing protein n=1 Tax=Amycolatopsis sp. cmx-11-32 TaxID=2785796 RepID=UPI0039E5B18A